MTIARVYIMHAAEGKDASLETFLGELADTVRTVAGCEGVEMLRDLGNERRFLFIEKWATVEAHKEAGKVLPRELFSGLMANLDGPPDGAYFDYLKTV